MLPLSHLKFDITELNRCLDEMYIDPDIDISPLGFKLSSGIDDAIWFKFTAKTDDIADVFDSDVVDTSRFKRSFKFYHEGLTAWWDAAEQSLTGEQVQLPNARFMNVGCKDNEDGTLTVYIMWHET